MWIVALTSLFSYTRCMCLMYKETSLKCNNKVIIKRWVSRENKTTSTCEGYSVMEYRAIRHKMEKQWYIKPNFLGLTPDLLQWNCILSFQNERVKKQSKQAAYQKVTHMTEQTVLTKTESMKDAFHTYLSCYCYEDTSLGISLYPITPSSNVWSLPPTLMTLLPKEKPLKLVWVSSGWRIAPSTWEGWTPPSLNVIFNFCHLLYSLSRTSA